MRGHYELSLSDGTKIPMRFCTWSLKRFCQLQGIGPSEIGEALSGDKSLDAIVNLLKAAAEYPLYYSKLSHCHTALSITPDWWTRAPLHAAILKILPKLFLYL